MKNKLPLLITFALILILALLEYLAPKPIDWTPTFNDNDKRPYGRFIISRIIKDNYHYELDKLEKSFYEEMSEHNIYNDTLNNIIFINDEFNIDRDSYLDLLNWIKKGNFALISSTYLPHSLLDSLGLVSSTFYPIRDKALRKESYQEIKLTNPKYQNKTYKYYQTGLYRYFSSFDSTKTNILGRFTDGKINNVAVKYGKGIVYINTLPYIFTNYNLVKDNNIEYAAASLSYLNEEYYTYWDTHFTMKPGEAQTPLRYLLSKAALTWAYYIALISGFLFVIFKSKRLQRVIPIIKKPRNATIDFASTISNLFLYKKDNKAIAEKKMRHFFEFIRNRFRLNYQYNEDYTEFFERLSLRSGISQEELKDLFHKIGIIQNSINITDKELIDFNNEIDDFYIKATNGRKQQPKSA